MKWRRTIKREARFEGIGLFSGTPCRMKFIPGTPDKGVVFVRTDLPGAPEVRAVLANAVQRLRRSSLEEGGVTIETVEHLLAALGGIGIDNLRIEMDAEEVPAADGSALPFVEVLLDAGLVEQNAPRTHMEIVSAASVSENGASIAAMPAPKGGLLISYTLEYDNPLISRQFFTVRIEQETFVKELAPARTFCLETEVKPLLDKGFGKGATYENTLVVGSQGVIENRLRFEDEFVRHKILDIVGDLFLLGAEINGHIVGLRSGHALNFKLIREIVGKNLRKIGQSVIDVKDIWRVLPHRYPFLLIDRVLEVEDNRRAVGIKNVTINEEFFNGHFPNQPIMPGVLQVEAMAQLAGVMFLMNEKLKGKLALITGLDKVKLRKPVVPGDQLVIEAEMVKTRGRWGLVRTCARVEGKIVAQAEITFMLVEALKEMGD